MDNTLKPFSVMTIDGLHYIKSVIVSDNPYELTLLCDTSWESEVFEVPATVVYHGKEYTVTGIDVGQSTQLKTLRELRISPTVRHIFPEACVSITSLRKVNIPDNCRVHSGAFAHCGIEELILGENVILEEDCFEGIRAKQVNIPDTTKWRMFGPEDYEDVEYYDPHNELLPVSADNILDFIAVVFCKSIWHYMELLKCARKEDGWAKREFTSGISSMNFMNFMISLSQNESLYKPSFSPDEILCFLDENEKHWISQFKENQERMNSSEYDLPF